MMTALTILALGLLAANGAFLYRKALREIRSTSEYTQFLFMNPDSYEDQRKKFVEYLGGTGAKTSLRRGRDAQRALPRIAENMRPQLVVANVTARNALACKT